MLVSWGLGHLSLRLRHLGREVGLGLLVPVGALQQHGLWFLGVVPVRAALLPVADVDGAPLFVVEHLGPASPDQTLNANVPVVYELLILAQCPVLVGVSHHLQSPSCLSVQLVFGDRLEPLFERVLGLKVLYQFLFVHLDSLRNFRLKESESSVLKDVLRVVNPAVERGKEFEVRQFPLLTSRLDFFLVFCVDDKHSLGHDLTAEADPDDLALEQVGLIALEVRIGEHWAVQVSAEDVLDPPGSVELFWCHNRQLLPLAFEKVTRHPVSVLIDSCSLRFDLWRQLTFVATFSSNLQDIVVPLPSKDLSPELCLLDSLSHHKSLYCFKDEVGSLLSKAHTCFFKHLGFLHEVSHISTWPWLLGLLL